MRSGKPFQLYHNEYHGILSEEQVLALVPDFTLDERTARFFGGQRLASYENTGSGVGGKADLKLLAIEVGELLDAIDQGTPVEVGAEEGLAAVALVMACHESSQARRTVSMTEVASGRLSTYQDVANRELRIEG